MTDTQPTPVEGVESASDTSDVDWGDVEARAMDIPVEAAQGEENAGEDESEYEELVSDLPKEDSGEEDSEDADGADSSEGESEEEEESEEQEVEADEEESDAPKPKIFKAKNADGEVVEVSNDLKFRFKEDGKFVTRTLQELKDNSAGKVAWNARIAEANRMRKEVESEKVQFQSDLLAVNEVVGEFYTEIQNNNLEGALGILASLVKKTPSEFVGNFIRSVKASSTRYQALTDEEINNLILQLDNKHLKSNIENTKKKASAEQERVVLQNKKQEYMDQFELSHDILKEVYDALVEQDDDGSIKSMSGEQILETVVLTALDYRIDSNLRVAYEELGVEPNEEDVSRLLKIVKAVDDSAGKDLELQDYVDFVQAQVNKKPGVVTGKAAKNLGRKVKTRKTKPKKVKQSEPEFKEGDTRDSIWDALDA